MPREFLDRAHHFRIPDPRPHLKSLDEELSLDHAARSRFKIELVGRAAAIPADPLQHPIDLREQIIPLPDMPPDALRQLHELILKRPGERPRAC